MNLFRNRKIIIGLVGYRCCGKSTLRGILTELNYIVFNTNSVKTGDPDANQISIDEILSRYGKNESYFLYLKNELELFVANNSGPIFIDSFKVPNDVEVVKKMFPQYEVEVWYLHTSNQTRLKRYINRDVNSNIRVQDLNEHDVALERNGIWALIKLAKEVINMEVKFPQIKEQVLSIILRKDEPS